MYIHQVLKLSENGIKEVDQKAFLNLGTSLEHLDLSGNKLKMVQEETRVTRERYQTTHR